MGSKGFSKGIKVELEASNIYHHKGLALLVDPFLLRSFGLGQIDLALFSEGKILVIEVKSSHGPHHAQYMRINKTVKWLGDLFKRPVIIDLYFAGQSGFNKNNARQEEKRFLP